MTKSVKHIIILMFSMSLAFLSGCYKLTSIVPTEIPKLNNSYSVQVGSTNRTDYGSNGSSSTTTSPIMAVSVRHLRKTDGKVLSVKGENSIIITTKAGKYTFKPPLIARLDGGNLIVAGSNRPNITFPLDSIIKAQIEQLDVLKTVVVCGVGIPSPIILLLLLLL
jgi:hypothetical protein